MTPRFLAKIAEKCQLRIVPVFRTFKPVKQEEAGYIERDDVG